MIDVIRTLYDVLVLTALLIGLVITKTLGFLIKQVGKKH